MARLCNLCAGISFKRLIELAKEEYAGGLFPEKAFLKHHACFRDLEQAAVLGCELCTLISESYKDSVRFYGPRWACLGYDITLASDDDGLSSQRPSDVRLALSNLHTRSSSADVETFDALLVHFGPNVLGHRPTLRLTLSTARGQI